MPVGPELPSLAVLAEIAEDTDRMVRNCLETLDELRRE